LHHFTELQAGTTPRFFSREARLHPIGNTFVEMKLKFFVELIVSHKIP